ncbi:hypothetical protein [Prosthecobacter sp.]|uniref:hypothetical protein n=1 Tax=Prosthecobacter sp. TaxID=1965333 RepID=UPI0037846980
MQPHGIAQTPPALLENSTAVHSKVSVPPSAGYALAVNASDLHSSASQLVSVSSDNSFSAVPVNVPTTQPVAGNVPGSSASIAEVVGMVPAAAPVIKLPLVFSNINIAALNLTSQEVAGIDRLRTSFTKAVGQQNPNDPQYAERWAEAQPSADDKLRALLGWNRFNSYLLQASRVR